MHSFQFDICLNTISGLLINDQDVLGISWKSPIFKGKLKPITVSFEDENVAHGYQKDRKIWWNQQIKFETVLWLYVYIPFQNRNRKEKKRKRKEKGNRRTSGENITHNNNWFETVSSKKKSS